MLNFIKNNKEKLWVISKMDLKLRYQNSVIGFAWSFLKPVLQFVVYYTVFGFILKVGAGIEYALQLFFGVIIWTFFAESTSIGLNSFVSKASIISKIRVDKLIPPISSFITPFFSLCINFTIFYILYMFIYDGALTQFSLSNYSIFIVSLIQISILVISLNIILSFSFVFFRDLQQIWEIVLIYGVFLTPILYKIPIPENYQVLYYTFNPLAFPLENMKIAFFSNYSTVLVGNSNIWVSHTFFLLVISYFSYRVKKRFESNIVDYL
ncbi:ABC transporter permease [Candidatus Thioglobus sp.]|jgi:ABC-2 type transport system permease protein|nr:ABC transporter permease [Candidatus Thioglobus sp.]